MSYMSAEDRFMRDPAFHNAVKAMVRWMEELQLTPTEIREAAALAAFHFYQTHPHLPAMEPFNQGGVRP